MFRTALPTSTCNTVLFLAAFGMVDSICNHLDAIRTEQLAGHWLADLEFSNGTEASLGHVGVDEKQ